MAVVHFKLPVELARGVDEPELFPQPAERALLGLGVQPPVFQVALELARLDATKLDVTVPERARF